MLYHTYNGNNTTCFKDLVCMHNYQFTSYILYTVTTYTYSLLF